MSLRVCRKERAGLQLDTLVNSWAAGPSERETEDTGSTGGEMGVILLCMLSTGSKDPDSKIGTHDFLVQVARICQK